MTAQAEALCLVLDCREYRESSQLAVFLTEEGERVAVVARGSRRAKKLPLDRFALGHAVWRVPRGGGGLGTLLRWELDRAPNVVHESYLAYLLASIWAETLLVFCVEGSQDQRLFHLTVEFFENLETSHSQGCLPSWSLLYLFWEALAVWGYVGRWARCGVCGRSADLPYFSWRHMAAACEYCVSADFDLWPVSGGLARGLARRSATEKVAAECLSEFFALYHEVVQRVSEQHLPSVQLLRQHWAR